MAKTSRRSQNIDEVADLLDQVLERAGHLAEFAPEFLADAVDPRRELFVAAQLLDRVEARVEVAFVTQAVCRSASD